MIEPGNGQALSLRKHNPRLPHGHQARYTAETVLRTRPKTYRKAVQLLADPNWSVLQISKTLRLSEHTVRAIRHREAQEIAERKKSLSAIVANVAELRSRADSRASVFDSGSIRLVLLVQGKAAFKILYTDCVRFRQLQSLLLMLYRGVEQTRFSFRGSQSIEIRCITPSRKLANVCCQRHRF